MRQVEVVPLIPIPKDSFMVSELWYHLHCLPLPVLFSFHHFLLLFDFTSYWQTLQSSIIGWYIIYSNGYLEHAFRFEIYINALRIPALSIVIDLCELGFGYNSNLNENLHHEHNQRRKHIIRPTWSKHRAPSIVHKI